MYRTSKTGPDLSAFSALAPDFLQCEPWLASGGKSYIQADNALALVSKPDEDCNVNSLFRNPWKFAKLDKFFLCENL
jgi:hypothetical protein